MVLFQKPHLFAKTTFCAIAGGPTDALPLRKTRTQLPTGWLEAHSATIASTCFRPELEVMPVGVHWVRRFTNVPDWS